MRWDTMPVSDSRGRKTPRDGRVPASRRVRSRRDNTKNAERKLAILYLSQDQQRPLELAALRF